MRDLDPLESRRKFVSPAGFLFVSSLEASLDTSLVPRDFPFKSAI